MRNSIRCLCATSFFLLLLIVFTTDAYALTEVTRFGSNPGDLRMWKHIPNGLPANAPLVVALHGCTQNAAVYAETTGWRELADRHRFALLLPEQHARNNARLCFNWFNGWAFSDIFFWGEWGSDQGRDTGEALSIKQMIDTMRSEHGVDSQRIFITGLSGGGAMTAVMLAAYPELFAGGAIFAGVPHRCAKTTMEALQQCGIDLDQSGSARMISRSAADWAREVRDATSHNGPWPLVSIWHGDADRTVIPDASRELLAQWAAVHEIDTIADQETRNNAVTRREYRNADGTTLVDTYSVSGMAHGVPVDPGTAPTKCGQTGAHAFAIGVCGAHAVGKAWGLFP